MKASRTHWLRGGLKKTILGILLLASAICSGTAAANSGGGTKPKEPQTSICHCLKIPDGAIRIDGNLTEPDWDKAEKIYFRGIADGAMPPGPSFARLLWDNQYLYVGYNISDTNVAAFYGDRKRGSTYRGHPNPEGEPWTGESEIMWRDTFVKLFIDPDADGLDYVEIHINPINNTADLTLKYPNTEKGCSEMGILFNGGAKFVLEDRYDWFWNCEGLRSAVQVQGTLNYSNDCDQGWTAEAAVPWAALKHFTKGDCPPRPGQKWRLHAGAVYKPEFEPEKRRKSHHLYWTWPVIGVTNCHLPSRWGLLFFDEPPDQEKASGRELKWKMTWCWTLPCASRNDVENGVKMAHELGFNAMEWSQAQAKFPEIFAQLCRENGLESYYCIAPRSTARQEIIVSECSLPDNPQAGGEPLPDDIGKVIDKGCARRPCFGQPDALKNAREDVDKAIKLGFDGIALDFVGYGNFHGCYCPRCRELRGNYIDSHPGLSEQEAANRFAEESIIMFYDAAISYAKSARHNIKTTCHIYPVFMPNILYGNRLPVDYCGQTVSWFFAPHWDLEKVGKYTAIVVKEEGRYHPKSIGTPFIGFYCKDKYANDKKTAERIRAEINLVKKSAAKGIQLVELGHILADKEVSRAVAEELGGRLPDFPRNER
ncbi:MAG: carbohydrate-binding family 9-like protein [Kiritimatiellae bacterium]|nr:carbohydrate-binding family 9-like protein [Kiritimatiellia bacterium]